MSFGPVWTAGAIGHDRGELRGEEGEGDWVGVGSSKGGERVLGGKGMEKGKGGGLLVFDDAYPAAHSSISWTEPNIILARKAYLNGKTRAFPLRLSTPNLSFAVLQFFYPRPQLPQRFFRLAHRDVPFCRILRVAAVYIQDRVAPPYKYAPGDPDAGFEDVGEVGEEGDEEAEVEDEFADGAGEEVEEGGEEGAWGGVGWLRGR